MFEARQTAEDQVRADNVDDKEDERDRQRSEQQPDFRREHEGQDRRPAHGSSPGWIPGTCSDASWLTGTDWVAWATSISSACSAITNDVSGMTQSSHHFGMIKSLNSRVPSRTVLIRTAGPTNPVNPATAMIAAKTPYSTRRATAGVTRDITMSTGMCSLVRKRCGATKKVEMKRPYSVNSISPMIEGNPNIRRITSALTPIAITAITRIASTHSERISQPLRQKIRRMPKTARTALVGRYLVSNGCSFAIASGLSFLRSSQ